MSSWGAKSKADDVMESFEEFMKKRLRYIIFKVVEEEKNEEDLINVDCMGTKEETFEDFVAKLRELEAKAEPRFCVVKFEYEIEDMVPKHHNVFISWIPEKTRISRKMLHASKLDYLKKKIGTTRQLTFFRADDVTRCALFDCCQPR